VGKDAETVNFLQIWAVASIQKKGGHYMKWTGWKQLSVKADHTGPAVYRFRVAVNGAAAVVHRFLGADKRGLLCIGMTGNMERRKSDFSRGLRNGRGHSTANLLIQCPTHKEIEKNHPQWPFADG